MAPLTYETGLHKDVISGLILSSTGLIILVRSVNSIFSEKTAIERPEYIPNKQQSLGSNNTFFLSE